MRWGPGRSLVAWYKTLRTLRVPAGDGCGCDDDEEEVVNTLRNGQGAPDADLGIDGDFYIDTDTDEMYGPKGGIGGSLPGEWVFAGSPISLVGPEGPNPEISGRKILFGDDPTTPIGGATHATISSDGYIEHHTASQTVATEGNERTSDDYEMAAGASNRRLIQTLSGGGSKRTAIYGSRYGSGYEDEKTFEFTYVVGLEQASVKIIDAGGNVIAQGTAHIANSGVPWFEARPNLYVGYETPPNVDDPFKAGRSAIMFYKTTATPGTPEAGYSFLYAHATTRHPMWKLDDGTTYDLTDTGSGEGAFATVTSTGTIPDVDVTGVRTIKVTSNGNVTIPGLTAPAAGESQHVTLILEPPADTTYTLSNNNGDDLANGFDFGGSDLTVANPATKVFAVVYDHDAEIWKPVGVSA